MGKRFFFTGHCMIYIVHGMESILDAKRWRVKVLFSCWKMGHFFFTTTASMLLALLSLYPVSLIYFLVSHNKFVVPLKKNAWMWAKWDLNFSVHWTPEICFTILHHPDKFIYHRRKDFKLYSCNTQRHLAKIPSV